MPQKPIKFGKHALFEMKRRGIRRSLAEAAIRAADQIVPSSKGRDIYQTLIGARRRMLLRVIVKESDTAYHVVTAYKTSKVAKYWKDT